MKRQTHGQSIVELALILPFLILFTVGTMELGYYVYTYSELENVTRRASEWAAKTPPLDPAKPNDPADQCIVLIKEYALEGAFLSDLTPANITFSYPGAQLREVGTGQVQVRVQYNGQWLTPIGNRFFGNQLKFNFFSRRTITSTKAPPGRNPDCSKSIP